MQYRKDKYGNDISALGFGCMRFQRSAGSINMAEAERELLAAVDAGINYFDTAYIYPGRVHFLGKTLLVFALLHSAFQGQICLLLQVFLEFLQSLVKE